ncbi:MAG: DUF485 domain-containing protein [Alphaproteobacteria bacterium]|nr:DUF485 domain-containing protein [Alphaproteobacteria bacterium]
MSEKSPAEIGAMPEYKLLLSKKRAVTTPLTIIMLVAYYAFVLLVAYDPGFLSTKLSDGITSLGIVLGLGLIILTLAITTFYVWYANSHLENLISKIQEKAGSHD